MIWLALIIVLIAVVGGLAVSKLLLALLALAVVLVLMALLNGRSPG